MKSKPFWILILLTPLLLFSCGSPKLQPTPISTPVDNRTLTPDEEETATLLSLKQVDDHPLYVMHYVGTFLGRTRSYVPAPADLSKPVLASVQTICSAAWACSLFAALGNPEERVLGRNFDWQFSPALLLFTDPADGYASVSMVDIEYLGFAGDRSKNPTDLPLEERRALLNAPSLPFDGMNEKGLAVGMAAVPREQMPYDPQKRTVDQLEVIREILDHAGTVDEAIEIMGNYNIHMGSVPIHYLIAYGPAGGKSVARDVIRMILGWTMDYECWRSEIKRASPGNGRLLCTSHQTYTYMSCQRDSTCLPMRQYMLTSRVSTR